MRMSDWSSDVCSSDLTGHKRPSVRSHFPKCPDDSERDDGDVKPAAQQLLPEQQPSSDHHRHAGNYIIERPTQGRQPDTAYGKHQSNDCDHRAEDYGRPILPGRCGDRLCHWHTPWLAFGLFACPRANEYRPIPASTPDMSSRSAAVTFGASAEIGRASCRERVCQYV